MSTRIIHVHVGETGLCAATKVLCLLVTQTGSTHHALIAKFSYSSSQSPRNMSEFQNIYAVPRSEREENRVLDALLERVGSREEDLGEGRRRLFGIGEVRERSVFLPRQP
jgi:hypothetical protein